MLWTVFVVFAILWILGLANVIAIGAWTWLFFVIAIIALIAGFTAGRRAGTRPAA
jgi:hypothetical protein